MKYLIRSFKSGEYNVSLVDACNMCEFIFDGSLADCYAFIQLKNLGSKVKLDFDYYEIKRNEHLLHQSKEQTQ